jgi:uncharacterized protein (DUF2062 family)
MTQESLIRDLMPSMAVGTIVVCGLAAFIGIILVQRAARGWMHQRRTERLRERVSRVEARGRQAAM